MASKKIVILAVIAALVIAAGSIAVAKVESGKAGQGNCMMQERMMNALGLTDVQKAKINSICETYKPQLQTLRNDTKLTPDQKKAKLQDIRKLMRGEISAVLTPDQQKKFDQMKARMNDKREGIQSALAKLGLTDDQNAKIKSIFESHKGEMKAIRDDASLTKDQKMVKTKTLHETIVGQVKGVLTPEQQKKLDDMMAQKHEGHKGQGLHGKQ